MTDWKLDPDALTRLGDCEACHGHGAVTAVLLPSLEGSEGAIETHACTRCGGSGHKTAWPWPGAEVFAREYELPGEGWRRAKEAFPDRHATAPAWRRYSPESGQHKANVYGWRVRDLDRNGNVVRVYVPRHLIGGT